MKQKLCETLKYLRKEHWLTQKEVASAAGLTRGAYAQIERGKNKPSVEILLNLAALYRLTTDQLLKGKISVS